MMSVVSVRVIKVSWGFHEEDWNVVFDGECTQAGDVKSRKSFGGLMKADEMVFHLEVELHMEKEPPLESSASR